MNAPVSDLLPGDELIDIAHVPNGDRLRLVRNGDDFVILLDKHELMSTDLFSSEEALATMTCERLGTRADLQMLIGGYGMGFTLRAPSKPWRPTPRSSWRRSCPRS